MTPNLNIQPDIKVSLKQSFGIDSEMEGDAFSKRSEYVPEIVKIYKFYRYTTLAIISGFAFNKRVLVQGYHGTGKSTHIEQIAARLNWPCIRVNLDSHVSRIDLIGKDAIVLKDGKELEDYIVNNNKELKKLKRGSKDYLNALDLEKSKMNIQRFKGLGEMNPEELWNTTLDPETRNLLQVQYSKDLKKDQSLIHTLMGSDVALRKDFIVSNAINVKNLDI